MRASVSVQNVESGREKISTIGGVKSQLTCNGSLIELYVEEDTEELSSFVGQKSIKQSVS